MKAGGSPLNVSLTTGVEPMRHFQDTGQTLGVGYHVNAWFVYTRTAGDHPTTWQMHCGPYRTREQAEGWIRAIREADTGEGR